MSDDSEEWSGGEWASVTPVEPICSGDDVRAALTLLGVDASRVRTAIFDAPSCTLMVFNGDGSHRVWPIAAWR